MPIQKKGKPIRSGSVAGFAGTMSNPGGVGRQTAPKAVYQGPTTAGAAGTMSNPGRVGAAPNPGRVGMNTTRGGPAPRAAMGSRRLRGNNT